MPDGSVYMNPSPRDPGYRLTSSLPSTSSARPLIRFSVGKRLSVGPAARIRSIRSNTKADLRRSHVVGVHGAEPAGQALFALDLLDGDLAVREPAPRGDVGEEGG